MRNLGLVCSHRMVLLNSHLDSAVLLPVVMVSSIFHKRGRKAISIVSLPKVMQSFLGCEMMSVHRGHLVVR